MCSFSIHLTGLLIISNKTWLYLCSNSKSKNESFRNEVYAVTIDGYIQNIYSEQECAQRSLLSTSKPRFLDIPVTVVLLRNPLKLFESLKFKESTSENYWNVLRFGRKS